MTRRRLFQGLTVLWLLFIWGHSLLPASVSGAESGHWLALLQGVLPWLTDFSIRKAAHFTEFAVLGGLVLASFPRRGLPAGSQRLLAGLLTAMIDETIQLFSPGRSGQITDVWLDLAGFLAGWLLIRILFFRKSEEK